MDMDTLRVMKGEAGAGWWSVVTWHYWPSMVPFAGVHRKCICSNYGKRWFCFTGPLIFLLQKSSLEEASSEDWAGKTITRQWPTKFGHPQGGCYHPFKVISQMRRGSVNRLINFSFSPTGFLKALWQVSYFWREFKFGCILEKVSCRDTNYCRRRFSAACRRD